MTGEGTRKGTGFALAAAIALVSAAGFLAFARQNIEAQGAYYDELNKAVPAFAFVGRPSVMFSQMKLGGIPTMVIPYKAATKAWLYGPWMWATGRPFTIGSWRTMALGLVAVGIALFVILARRALPWWALLTFAALTVTDANVIVSSRHDWGPVAFGLLCRMVFLGAWLRGQAAPSGPKAGNTFVLALLVGFSAFDKLNSVVLLVPFALCLVLDPFRRRPRHLVAAAAGGLLGALPLIVVNVVSWLRDRTLISMHSVQGTGHVSESELLRVLGGTFSLGAGGPIREQVFGQPPRAWAVVAEGALVAALNAIVLFATGRRAPGPHARAARIAALSFLALPVAFVLLPRQTESHHWTLGTPFHYLAIVAALAGLAAGRGAAAVPPPSAVEARLPSPRILLAVLSAILVALAVLRSLGVADIQRHLAAGSFGPKWNPDLTAFAREMAAVPDDHGVLAADWGIATQVFCFSQGRQNHVKEIFRGYEQPEQIALLGAAMRKRVLQVAALNPRSGVAPATAAPILKELVHVPGWRVAPTSGHFRWLDVVTIERIVPR